MSHIKIQQRSANIYDEIEIAYQLVDEIFADLINHRVTEHYVKMAGILLNIVHHVKSFALYAYFNNIVLNACANDTENSLLESADLLFNRYRKKQAITGEDVTGIMDSLSLASDYCSLDGIRLRRSA